MKTTKQKYHLEPDNGLLNDPNGLVYFKGKYYVFFQWNRHQKDHSFKEWGLFTSKDMVNWEFKGGALQPNKSFDSHGVYSGCAYVIENKMYLYYTGNNKEKNKRKSSQCLAVSNDGIEFSKKGIIIKTPKGYTEHFRDPKVFRYEGSNYFMVVGAQKTNGKGAIAIFTSFDGKEWTYLDVLADSRNYEMIECPDLFKIEDKEVLLFNPQKRNNSLDTDEFSFSAYKFINFDENSATIKEKNLDTSFTTLDYGFDFYAPQTFVDENNRRVLIAWMAKMNSIQEEYFSKNDNNIHCLTIPRELYIKSGKLYQLPIAELYNLLEEPLSYKEFTNSIKFESIHRSLYLKFSDESKFSENICVKFQDELTIEYIYEKKIIRITRKNWVSEDLEFRECIINDLKDIEMWVDNSSIELFINNGEKVLSSRFLPEHNSSKVIINNISASTKVTVRNIRATV